MTKTVILTGAELRVEELGGQNAVIKNLGSETIWASAYPNVTAGANNVIEIPAGSGEVLLDARGTVYLLGNGKVQCTGTDQATVNFKMPSSSVSGGGGEEPIGETMPVMDGISAYLYPESGGGSTRYLSKPAVSLTFDNDEENEALLMQSRSGAARLHAADMPVIVYMVFKTPNNGTIIDRSLSPGYNYGMGLYVSNHAITCHSCNSDGIITDTSAVEYHVVVLVGYDMENGKTEQRLYIDGELAGINTNNYGASAHARELYGGYMVINGIARPGFQFDSDVNIYLKYFSMGSIAHTEEQIKQNSKWLMKKYGVGGD